MKYARDTYIHSSLPWGIIRAARAICPDGVVRTMHRVAETYDTFFSIPASVTIRRAGKRYTVSGFVSVETEEGWSFPSEGDPLIVKFIPYTYGKNAAPAFGAATCWKRDEA